jgi:tRNA pseudouridine55 synthase
MARRKPPQVHGACIIDKPAGMTSHDAVNRLRRILGERRIGHAGTLDPDATGVLVVGVGNGTRLLQFVDSMTKSYSCEVVLGTTTSTLDAAGEVTGTFDMSSVTGEAMSAAVAGLTGPIEQIPPMVSAVSIGGVRLHELARQGIEIERPARAVMIHRFEVTPTDDPMLWRADVECSTGTYVRTLVDDLGRLLGGGAHLRALRRPAVGRFTVERSSSLDAPELLDVEVLVEHLTRIEADTDVLAGLSVGRVTASPFAGVPPWRVHHPDGHLLAMYEPFRDGAKPVVNFAAG